MDQLGREQPVGSPRRAAASAEATRPPDARGLRPDFFRTDFGTLSEPARAALARAAVSRRLETNDFVYLQDDEARALHFVTAGHVRLSYLMEDGSAILHAILPAGESFGELGVFEGSTYCDMATAVGQAGVASVPIGALRALTAQHPEIGEALARVVARRYRGFVTLTRDLSLKSLSARLAQAVLRLVDGLGARERHRGREVGALGSVVTQSDLGLMARGSRGNVNRVLKTWERAGLIAIEDRRVLILDRGRLESVVMEDV